MGHQLMQSPFLKSKYLNPKSLTKERIVECFKNEVRKFKEDPAKKHLWVGGPENAALQNVKLLVNTQDEKTTLLWEDSLPELKDYKLVYGTFLEKISRILSNLLNK